MQQNLETIFFIVSEAYVTLATSDQCALGAMTLCASLKRVQTVKKLVIMATGDVSSKMRHFIVTFKMIIKS